MSAKRGRATAAGAGAGAGRGTTTPGRGFPGGFEGGSGSGGGSGFTGETSKSSAGEHLTSSSDEDEYLQIPLQDYGEFSAELNGVVKEARAMHRQVDHLRGLVPRGPYAHHAIPISAFGVDFIANSIELSLTAVAEHAESLLRQVDIKQDQALALLQIVRDQNEQRRATSAEAGSSAAQNRDADVRGPSGSRDTVLTPEHAVRRAAADACGPSEVRKRKGLARSLEQMSISPRSAGAEPSASAGPSAGRGGGATVSGSPPRGQRAGAGDTDMQLASGARDAHMRPASGAKDRKQSERPSRQRDLLG
jgi:hypothetical protein